MSNTALSFFNVDISNNYVSNTGLSVFNTDISNNYVRNTVLSAFNYVQRGVANTFTALQTFNNGIRVAGQSYCGDICGNFFSDAPIIPVTVTTQVIIPAQTAMLIYILVTATAASNIRLTVPDSKYFGQKFILINRTGFACGVFVPTGTAIWGNGGTFTVNGGYSATSHRIHEIYYGGLNGATPYFMFRT